MTQTPNERLRDIWTRQQTFNDHFFNHEADIEEKQTQTKELVLLLQDEVMELLREINFKAHRNPRNVITSNIVEEWIDIYKYWLSIGLIWNFTPEDFEDEFYRKSRVVEQRYKQEKQLDLLNDDRIIAVDIDGVLANYPESFQQFILDKTGVYKQIQSYNLYDEYADVLGYERMLELKHEYRNEGHKRFIPVIDGAWEFLNHFHEDGYTIVLLTSRPYKEYKRIFGDTIEWLHKNDLKYDAIIWDETKHLRVIQEFPNIEFMVEDNWQYAVDVASRGYTVYLVDQPYNQNREHDNIIRVDSPADIP